MFIDRSTKITTCPYIFDNPGRCIQYCKDKMLGMPRSLWCEWDKDHVDVYPPFGMRMFTIYGDEEEIKLLLKEMTRLNMLRSKL